MGMKKASEKAAYDEKFCQKKREKCDEKFCKHAYAYAILDLQAKCSCLAVMPGLCVEIMRGGAICFVFFRRKG
ncbi:MAG: hypothetical protein HFH87_06645 [Lachnospiraceae bacterium]|nr:hypothetical protein [Lachnospiraceae bacterium]